MDKSNESWIQRASGVWISWRAERAQSGGVELADDLVVERDWVAYWRTQGQLWRREPEVETDRQFFLWQRILTSAGRSPFKDVALTRADIEWLIRKHGEQRENGTEWGMLNLQGALCKGISFSVLPLERANFWNAQLEGANFEKARLQGANFVSAQLERANFKYAQLEGANFVGAQLERAYFSGARIADTNFAGAFLIDGQGVR